MIVDIFNFPEPLSSSEWRSHYLRPPAQWENFFTECSFDAPNLHMIEKVRSVIEPGVSDAVIISGHPEYCRNSIMLWLQKHIKRDYNFRLFLRRNDDYCESVELRRMWYNRHLNKFKIRAVYENDNFPGDADFWKDKIMKGE